MLIYERDPRQRQLQTIYTPQEPRRVMPSDLAEEIVLVHPAQPFASSFNEIRSDAITGTAGATSVVGTNPGTDRYFWIHAFSGEHDDPVDRDMTLELEQATPSRNVAIAFFPAVPAGQQRPSPRSFYVPFGWRLRVRVNAIAAGQVVLLRSMFVDFLEGEVAPPL